MKQNKKSLKTTINMKKEISWEYIDKDGNNYRITATRGQYKQVFENEAIIVDWKIELFENNNIKHVVHDCFDINISLCDCIVLLTGSIQETLIKFAKYGSEIKFDGDECKAFDEDHEIWKQTRKQTRK